MPSDEEWKELEMFLGMTQADADNSFNRGTDEGGKLKETGITHWADPNTGATNESGFTALPGGGRDTSGTFYYIGAHGHWGSSTEYSPANAYNRTLGYDNSVVNRGVLSKKYGFSVRCLRDSCQFGYLTISDEKFKKVSDLNFYGDNISGEIILINSSAGKTINISSIYTKNPVFSLNKSSSTLSPGDSIHLTITFDPPVKDIYPDTIFVKSDDPYDSLITITLNGTFLPEISFIDSTNISCFGYFDGSATVTPSLGTPPYHYLWDDPINTADSTVTGLSPNIYYHVTVTDSLGWTVTDSIILSQPFLLASQITDSANISCFEYSDGTATITPSGGTVPYSYLWNDMASTTDSIVTGLSANQYYHIAVTDANGCMVTDSVIFSQPGMLLSSITDSSNISCYGYSDGSAIITITGGTRPYAYLWDDNLSTTDSTVTGLAANKYYHVNVTDDHGCFTIDSILLSEPDPLELNDKEYTSKLCAGSNEGFIHYNITGGTMPNDVIWSTGDTISDLNGLDPGKYYITVTDDNGCQAQDSTIIGSITTYQDAEICMVTVNNDNRILVVWDKTYNQGIASYNIYREQSRDQYVKIGSVPFDSLSVFVDEGSEPRENPYLYKISITDSCDVESSLSALHKSIHLQTGAGISQEVNLVWTEYEGFEYYNYEIYRGNSPVDLVSIRTISSSIRSWTDYNPPYGDVFYRVMVVKPDPCFPTTFKSEEYNAPFSNYDEETIVGIVDNSNEVLSIYPNPFHERTIITFPNPGHEEYRLILRDLTGKVVKQIGEITDNQVEVIRETLPSGLYIMELTGVRIFRGEVIIE